MSSLIDVSTPHITINASSKSRNQRKNMATVTVHDAQDDDCDNENYINSDDTETPPSTQHHQVTINVSKLAHGLHYEGQSDLNDDNDDEDLLGKASKAKAEQRRKRIQAAERINTRVVGGKGREDIQSADELAILLTGESLSSVVEDIEKSISNAMHCKGEQEGSGGSGKKTLLQERAESDLKTSIAVLRSENANLVVEILEVKRSMALHDEQVTCLKETIRELEASLCREREFNAANARMNTEYLVNILRKFLTSNSPEERSKLVSVLCTILYLQSEETRQIIDKWTVKSGPLSWFRGNRPLVDGPSPPQTKTDGPRKQNTQSFDPLERL